MSKTCVGDSTEMHLNGQHNIESPSSSRSSYQSAVITSEEQEQPTRTTVTTNCHLGDMDSSNGDVSNIMSTDQCTETVQTKSVSCTPTLSSEVIQLTGGSKKRKRESKLNHTTQNSER